MKTSLFPCLSAGLMMLALPLSPVSVAAKEEAPVEDRPAAAVVASDDEELIPFSPVLAEAGAPGSDSLGCAGYSRVELKDIGATVSVITAEFLKDLGSPEPDHLMCYTDEAKKTLAGAVAESGDAATETAAPGVAAEDDVVFCGGGFVVSEEDGVGYKASEIVAGVHHKTDLKDSEACLSLVTEDFLKEVCASSTKDLLVYTGEATAACTVNGPSAVPPTVAEEEVEILSCVDVTEESSETVSSDTLRGHRIYPDPKDVCGDASVVTEGFVKEIGASPGPLVRPRMEVVFVLDTTGSMAAMIEGAKQKIWALANRLKSAQPTPEIRFGLVGYRDHGDAYVTRVHGLGTDIDATYEQLTAFVADGGGDLPEAVNEALTSALHEIAWSADPQVLRAIFLVGDAPPHMDYGSDIKWKDSCLEAQKRGILINTLQCGDDGSTEKVWRRIAAGAGGAYTAIQQQGRTTAIETRFDGDIVGLTRALNDTIVPYGSSAEQASAGRNGALLDAMSVEGIADRSSFLSKTEAGAVISGKGDLVVELIAGRMTLGAIDPQLLDPGLAQLSVSERDALIQGKVERRRELQASLQKLLNQRETVVAEQMKAAEGTDDIVVLSPFEVLQGQAESKGYHFAK